MGLIDTIKRKIPSVGEPASDLSASDFEDFNPNEEGGEGDDEGDEQQGEENSEQGGGGDNEEQGDDEEQSGGSGEGDDESEEDDEQGGGGSEQENESDEEGDEQEGEGDSKGDEQQDGDSSSKSGNEQQDKSHNLDDEERENLKDEMESSSAERDMSEWNSSDDDYEEPSRFIKRYYENLQEERAEPETEIEKRKQERDERVEQKRPAATAEMVEDEYDSRFADEISEAFRKIKTRSAPKASVHGQRINMRGVVRRRSGDPTEERLYLEMEPSEVGDRCITVVVDSSGSMDDLEIKLALKALADACEQIGDRFAAVTYYTTGSWSVGDVRSDLITAPTEDFKSEHLNSFEADGLTPTSKGVLDGRAISDITPNSEDVLIVITDGIANVTIDGSQYDEHNYNNKAMKEANEQVNAAINEGKRVIGLGVGEHLENEAMRNIFGNDYVRTDMEGIADALVDIYREQMETSPSN